MPYKRKTKDEFQVHCLYENGWEEVTASDNRKEAREDAKAYRLNDRNALDVKVVKKRISKKEE